MRACTRDCRLPNAQRTVATVDINESSLFCATPSDAALSDATLSTFNARRSIFVYAYFSD